MAAMKAHEILAKLNEEERECVASAHDRECQEAFDRGVKAGREGSHELQRFREREQHVTAIADAASQALAELESLRGHGREGLLTDLRAALAAVRDFKIGGE